MKINIRIGDDTATAILEDNPTSRDFYSRLPLTVTFEDYNAAEKVTYLPEKLSTQGAPDGFDPAPGSITYFAPWGNIAIFYKDFGYSRSLINLGAIETGLGALQRSGRFSATIERVPD